MDDAEAEVRSLARRMNVGVSCPACSFNEPMLAYMDREGIVQDSGRKMLFECPECGNGELSLVQQDGTTVITVGGLPGLNFLG